MEEQRLYEELGLRLKKARIARHQPISAREARHVEPRVPVSESDTESDDEEVEAFYALDDDTHDLIGPEI